MCSGDDVEDDGEDDYKNSNDEWGSGVKIAIKHQIIMMMLLLMLLLLMIMIMMIFGLIANLRSNR